jgi:hypothetical protein
MKFFYLNYVLDMSMYSIVSAYNPESCANIAVEIKNYTTRVLARNSMSQLYMQVVL